MIKRTQRFFCDNVVSNISCWEIQYIYSDNEIICAERILIEGRRNTIHLTGYQKQEKSSHNYIIHIPCERGDFWNELVTVNYISVSASDHCAKRNYKHCSKQADSAAFWTSQSYTVSLRFSHRQSTRQQQKQKQQEQQLQQHQWLLQKRLQQPSNLSFPARCLEVGPG